EDRRGDDDLEEREPAAARRPAHQKSSALRISSARKWPRWYATSPVSPDTSTATPSSSVNPSWLKNTTNPEGESSPEAANVTVTVPLRCTSVAPNATSCRWTWFGIVVQSP